MNGNESSNELLPSLAVYNPALLKKEDLIAQFVARRALLDRLVGELRRSGKNGNQHHLIAGPRGSGKTMLLRRLRYAIEDDAELSSRWVPLVFPEEQYNVSRLSDLWVNCLDALSDMLERWNRKDEAESLDRRIDELPADDEKRRAQAALDLLICWAKKEDRGLVLLVDNADLIFDRLKDDHWAIREILSADNHLLFIGATIAPIEATYNHEGAFYDFFKIHELRGLNDEETREVLRTLARLRRTPYVTELLERDPGRIRSLNLLAGGNLRTVVVLYQALAQGSDDSIRADLEQLLDQYTPLYKHGFESLSAQSQQVVDALALNWDPATAADLAEKLRLETNAVSAVLNRLVKDGIVERAPSPPGEKMFFQIAERFFNIWYLMRASRRVRRRLMWLVEFLKMFYGSAELNRRARHLVQEPPPPEHDQFRRAELALLFAIAIEKPGLRRALETEGVRSLMSSGDEDRQSIRSILDLEGEDASLKYLIERFQALSELNERVEQAQADLPAQFWEHLIASPSLSLEEKKKTFEEVAQLGSGETKQLIEKFESEARRLAEEMGAEPCQELFESIRSGQMADGADVEGADAAAITGKDPSLRVVARLFRFDRTKDKALLDQAEGILTEVQSPHVWLSWAETVANSENYPKKLAGMCKRIVRLKGHDARTWQRVGNLQFHLGRYAEAESAYRKSIAFDPDAFTSWNDFGYLLAYCRERFDEAETAYRRAIELDPKSASPWFRLGDLLQRYLKRYEEAEAAFRKATELAPNAALPWGFLVQLLAHHLKRYEEAEVVCRQAIELNPKDAGLRMNLGMLLEDYLKRYVEAEAAYRQAIALEPNEAWSWVYLGRLFVQHLGRYEEAEAACRKAVELAPNEATMWMFFGDALIHLKKYEEAAAAYRKVIELNPNSELANSAWTKLSLSLQCSKRYAEAEAAVRKAIELNPNNSRHWMNLGRLLADHLKKYEEAEAAIRQAISLAPNDSGQWILLGKLLAYHLNRPDEAREAFRKAVELNENKAEYRQYLLNQDLDEAELHSRLSVVMDPDNLDFSCRAACIFIKRGEWDDAVIYARKFISEGDDEFHERNWPDIIGFFHDAVTSGHADEAVALLDETEYGERWRPLREALQAIAEDDSSHLLRVAPEIRRPAEEIVAMLLPVGVRLGSAPKSARARRTRRKKSLS